MKSTMEAFPAFGKCRSHQSLASLAMVESLRHFLNCQKQQNGIATSTIKNIGEKTNSPNPTISEIDAQNNPLASIGRERFILERVLRPTTFIDLTMPESLRISCSYYHNLCDSPRLRVSLTTRTPVVRDQLEWEDSLRSVFECDRVTDLVREISGSTSKLSEA